MIRSLVFSAGVRSQLNRSGWRCVDGVKVKMFLLSWGQWSETSPLRSLFKTLTHTHTDEGDRCVWCGSESVNGQLCCDHLMCLVLIFYCLFTVNKSLLFFCSNVHYYEIKTMSSFMLKQTLTQERRRTVVIVTLTLFIYAVFVVVWFSLTTLTTVIVLILILEKVTVCAV